MLNASAQVRISSPDSHAVRLGRYFEHRVPVHREDHLVRIHFPDATCEFRPGHERLLIHIMSRSVQALTRCREVITRNLRLAPEKVEIGWRLFH